MKNKIIAICFLLSAIGCSAFAQGTQTLIEPFQKGKIL